MHDQAYTRKRRNRQPTVSQVVPQVSMGWVEHCKGMDIAVGWLLTVTANGNSVRVSLWNEGPNGVTCNAKTTC